MFGLFRRFRKLGSLIQTYSYDFSDLVQVIINASDKPSKN